MITIRGPLFAVAAGLLLGCSAAFAGELPAALTTQQQIGAPEKATIRQFVDTETASLPGEPGAAQAARENLLLPLRQPVSVAFRLAYSEALMPTLARLAKGQDDRVAFNALRVAGALATQEACQTIQGAFTEPRASMRYAGAFAARRVLEELAANRAPAAGQGKTLLDALDKALRAEADPGVIDGLIAAYEVGNSDPQTHTLALVQMCAGLDAQAGGFDAAKRGADAERWAYAFQRGVKVAQQELLAQGRVGKLDADLAKGAAQMCGQLLAHVVRRLESFKPGEDHAAEIAALTDLGTAGEGTLVFIDANLAKRPVPIAQTIKGAFPDPAKVRSAAQTWAGPKGALTQAPYALKPMLP